MRSKYKWIIDAGHGGMKDGKYVTAPDKMVIYPDGYTIHEGVVNREIASYLIAHLMNIGINFSTCYEDVEDVPLPERVQIVNATAKYAPSVLLSIHSNASKDGIKKPGTGIEVYTSPGDTPSDPMAEVFCKTYMEDFPTSAFRADLLDGDYDKEAKFYMLVNTRCPAILVENFFMDNRREAEFLNSVEGQMKIANTLMRAILKIETNPKL